MNSMRCPRRRLAKALCAATLVVGLAVVGAAPANAATDDFYTWAKWRLGHAPYTCQAGVAWVRPNVRPNVPASWWERLKLHRPKPCPTSGEQAEPPAEPVAEPVLDAREASLRDAVNAERRSHGLAPLPIGTSLERAARDHTADMVKFGYFGHDWHNGASFNRWVTRYFACTAGEIIAWRSPMQNANNAVQQWLHSPGHRAALLGHDWTVMGVGLGQRHATVVFGGRCRA
jgi:uncharacterized protein YkwD